MITGCTSGIGLEIAKQLYDIGFNLLLISRNEGKLEKVKKDLHERDSVTDNKIKTIAIDFQSSSITEIFDKLDKARAEEGIEEIAFLANNVGIGGAGLYYATYINQNWSYHTNPFVLGRLVLPET